MDINNISPYIPTQYVDYSTPDINAVNLNKAEVALQRVTAAANEAINAIKELNAAKIDTAKIVTSLASTDTLSVLSGAIGPVIDQRLTDLLNKYNQLNGDPLMGAYIQNNVITEWLISRHASCGFISSSNSSINFPASATHFFVAVTDFWSIGIIAFPYGKNETTIYLGQYDEGGKTWRWIAK